MRRTRVTITLRNDVLKAIDQYVDGTNIRNRSNAIETVLDRYFQAEETPVVILAGGKGVKLRPLTYELPKGMLPIHGKPLLEHVLLNLKRQGIKRFVISTGYLGEKIQEYFGNGSRFGIDIDYSHQDKDETGTARPVLKAMQEQQWNRPVLVWYGDVLADISVSDLLHYHATSNGNKATIAITSGQEAHEWGVVKLKGSHVTQFSEKPDDDSSHFIYGGIAVIDPSVYTMVNGKVKSLEREVFPRLAEDLVLAGYPFDGQWFDVSTPTVYEDVLKKWKN